MVSEGYKVRRVKGAKTELFVIVAVNSQLPQDSLIVTSDGLNESELRSRLAKDFGRPESEFDSLIQEARENPPI